ncbi:uncharacterized protein BO97DRAFT_82203 [Aspergillus homomorphus CBS 101889]|uniref:Uncharacterized protein n=1 Tax=Aspergillus homomorphus (strain CBS 101889) TaxID=1450537 RepID=A0A395I9V7_ASPHC|nr:hypothetical protein BO97DRAFT_82203 [Aspergillus homomorphus CBS 101889]RAL17040.1 hypothetical protein BO97DRAFT_82203 [Aspergillus homomorphus CBS 101889]
MLCCPGMNIRDSVMSFDAMIENLDDFEGFESEGSGTVAAHTHSQDGLSDFGELNPELEFMSLENGRGRVTRDEIRGLGAATSRTDDLISLLMPQGTRRTTTATSSSFLPA